MVVVVVVVVVVRVIVIYDIKLLLYSTDNNC